MRATPFDEIRDAARAAGVTGRLLGHVVDRGPETDRLVEALAAKGIWFHYHDLPDFRDDTDRGQLYTEDALGPSVAAYYASSVARRLREWLAASDDLPADMRGQATRTIAEAEDQVAQHRRAPGFVELG